jgi:hypothetical protein
LPDAVVNGRRRSSRGPAPLPLAARLAAHLHPTRGGCLVYEGAKYRGYAVCYLPTVQSGRIHVRKLVWALAHGGVLPTAHLTTTCGVRNCVVHLREMVRKPRRPWKEK